MRDGLRAADLVVPSLDAGGPQVFQYVNRPHKDITFDKMLEGLVKFRGEYSGKYWLEVFVLAGVNTTEAEVEKLRACIDSIRPDKVQVNTVTRPPAEDFAEAVGQARLEVIAQQLYEKAEVIADYQDVHGQQAFAAKHHEILALLERRPCSVEDIVAGLGLHRNEVAKYIEELSTQGKVEATLQGGRLYYRAISKT